MIFDLTGVEYIDSAGIGVLALAAGKVKEVGGALAVVAGPGRVSDLLKLTQMDAVMKVCGSLADAQAALGGAAAGA